MNGKPGTRGEVAALDHAIGLERASGCDAQADALTSLRDKLTAPFRPKPTLPDPRAIQAALGVLTMTATEASWHQIAQKAAKVGATVADAAVIAPWLATQAWAADFTVDRVLSGWPSYLARARAWEARGKSESEGARRDFDPDAG